MKTADDIIQEYKKAFIEANGKDIGSTLSVELLKYNKKVVKLQYIHLGVKKTNVVSLTALEFMTMFLVDRVKYPERYKRLSDDSFIPYYVTKPFSLT